MTRLEEVQYLRTEPDGRHYNCAQSLLVPFGPEVGLTKEQADALGANFGAGMKMGSTCGVLTSALTLLSKAKEEGIPRKEHCDSLVFEMAKILDEEFFAQEK